MTLTPEQVEFRLSGCGGSDAGVIIGVSTYGDPLGLYMEKRSEVEIPWVETERQRWGHLHEESIAEAYRQDHPEYKVVKSNVSHRSKTHPFMIAHIDRKVQKCGNKRILECKSSGLPWDWGDSGTQDIPPSYMAQVQHYIHVLELDQVDLASLISGNDFRVYPIMRDQEYIDMLVEAETEFWDRVEAGVPPEPVWESAATTKLLKHLYPGTNGSVVRLPPMAQKYHDVLRDSNEQKLMYDKVVVGCKNRLQMLIGEATAGILPDGSVYTRKLSTRKEFTVSASENIAFRHTTKVPVAVTKAIEEGTVNIIEAEETTP